MLVNHILKSNLEPTNMLDRHKLMSDDTGKILVLKAKGNNGIRQDLDLLPFDNSKEYTTKTKTINEQKMRQKYVAPNSFTHLPTYSHETASKNDNENIRTLERDNKELKTLLLKSREALEKLTQED